MTNKEKLAEIENCVSTRSGDIEWLVERIKTLTAALQSIASEHRTGADCPEFWLELTHEQCADTNANDTQIARKALEDES